MLSPETISDVRRSYKTQLESELATTPSYVPTVSRLEEQWTGMVWPTSKDAIHDPATGVNESSLQKVGKASVAVPEGFVCIFISFQGLCDSFFSGNTLEAS